MPEYLRNSLGRGFLGVVVCGSEEYVTKKILELVEDCSGVIVVGDFICSRLLKYGYTPRVCVVDGLSRRTQAEAIPITFFSKIVKCSNPRSHICADPAEKIASAVMESAEGERILISVEGEEDLLALTSLATSSPGWCVVYGLPGCGAEVVHVDKETAETARKILELFEEVEIPSETSHTTQTTTQNSAPTLPAPNRE